MKDFTSVNKVQIKIHEFGFEVSRVLSNEKECFEWLKNLHDSLVYKIKGVSAYGDKLLEEALTFSEKQKSNAEKRWNKPQTTNTNTNTNTNEVTKDELYDFATEQQIPDGVVMQFYEMHKNRGWLDKNGKKIKNWKGAFKNFSKKILEEKKI